MMLYHYTEFVAFNGILKNAELRLNNILNMNDAQEMRLFMNGICSAVVSRVKEAGLEKEKLRKIESYFKEELQEEFHYSAYAACFSEFRDDASQWERYGNVGQGVCIGFHEEMLEKMVGGAVSLHRVYYQDSVTEHELVESFYKLAMKKSTFEKDAAAFQELMDEAWVLSAAFKHPSFSSEKEVRLVVSPFIANDFAIEPQYYIGKNRIKKYYPLNLNRMCDRAGIKLTDVIGEIIIGPTSTQSLPILADYLSDCGLGVLKDRIHLSTCPLRKPNL